jgi:PAS domain S-box-containing protein
MCFNGYQDNAMLQRLRYEAYHQFPEHGSPTQRWAWPIGIAVAVGLAYFLAARLSLFLLTEPNGVAVFWPAAGVSSGILIALGRQARWPVALGVMAATIAANLTSDRTIWGSHIFALCNAGEALLVAGLVVRYVGRDFSLGRLRHVAIFLAAAVVATAVSGLGGALGYKLFHSPSAPALITWQHWFASDVLGIITVAPLLIGLVLAVRDPPPQKELIEGALAIGWVAVTTATIIFVLPDMWRDIVVPVELLFPLLLWIAARCRPTFMAAAVFVVSLGIVAAITFGLGHFARTGPILNADIVGAQLGIIGVALCALVLTALFAERRYQAAVLIDSEERMRTIVNTVADGIITVDSRGIVENLNPAAARVFGYKPEEVIGHKVKMLLPTPYRDEHDSYTSIFLTTSGAKVIGVGRELAGRRKDGSVFPIELEVAEMEVAGRRMFAGVVRDITERKRVEEHQKLLVAELDHRVKNVLAQVTVVAMSTRQGSRSIGEFLRSLDGRIQSMAAAHMLLSQSGWQNVELDALVRKQLAPYATSTNITISGPEVVLGAAEIQAMAMVLHELVTNAAKYGALSSPHGQVAVNWERKPNAQEVHLTLVWQELGGPPILAPAQVGYGTSLIRDLIPHELGGTVDLAFASDGVRCEIEIPIKRK